ncbi:MAG: hypothetical protein QM715_20970 [Nibricoccus sp.]
MNDKHVRSYNMFGQVATYGQDNAADFAPGSLATANFAAVGGVISEINQIIGEQKGGSTSLKAVKLASLRAEMKNLARTAREIDKKEPGMADKFRMPANSAQTAVLAAALKMIGELKVEGRLAKFVAYEMSADIITELESLVQQIGDANSETASDNAEGVENTAAIGLAIARGKDLVESLDTSVRNRYKNQPAKIAAWETASHTERAPRRKKSEPPTPPSSSAN